MGSRSFELVELGYPHLVLTHVGNYYGVSFGELIERVYGVGREDLLASLGIGKRVFFFPVPYPAEPGFPSFEISFSGKSVKYLAKHHFGVSYYRTLNRYVLVYRGRIYVYVNNFRVGGKLLEVSARGPVVKTPSDRDNEIRFGNGHIGRVGTVHPEHAYEKRVACRIASEPHKGGSHRYLEAVAELKQFIRSLRPYNASP